MPPYYLYKWSGHFIIKPWLSVRQKPFQVPPPKEPAVPKELAVLLELVIKNLPPEKVPPADPGNPHIPGLYSSG